MCRLYRLPWSSPCRRETVAGLVDAPSDADRAADFAITCTPPGRRYAERNIDAESNFGDPGPADRTGACGSHAPGSSRAGTLPSRFDVGPAQPFARPIPDGEATFADGDEDANADPDRHINSRDDRETTNFAG